MPIFIFSFFTTLDFTFLPTEMRTNDCQQINPNLSITTNYSGSQPKKKEEKSEGTCTVTVANAYIIPAQSGQVIQCDLSQALDSEFIIEAQGHPDELVIPQVLLESGKSAKLCVFNTSDTNYTLQPGTPIATASVIAEVIPVDHWPPVDPLTEQASGPGSVELFGSDPVPTRICNTSFKSFNVTLAPTIPDETKPASCRPMPTHLDDMFNRATVNLDEQEKVSLRNLLIDYEDVFAKHDFDLGEFTALTHKIDTGDARPIKCGLRRTPLGFQDKEEEHLNKMLDTGIIQPSISDWAAAPVIVRKKCGSYRYCLDYRGLNSVTRKDNFPLPLIEECLDTLADNQYFSTLDMASGYWQILIDPAGRYKTAFLTKYGLFEHVRLAMGLCNSPATYQRAADAKADVHAIVDPIAHRVVQLDIRLDGGVRSTKLVQHRHQYRRE